MLTVKALNYVPDCVLKNFVTEQHQLNRLLYLFQSVVGRKFKQLHSSLCFSVFYGAMYGSSYE